MGIGAINIKSKKGFTIIEVVLVLAIAGLIFLMVFVALPSLQRGQRDTQRKQDMARLVTAVKNYQANNSGKIPSLNATFLRNYLRNVDNGDTFRDPSGSNYILYAKKTCTASDCPPSELTDTYRIKPYINATCDGEQPKYQKGAARVAFVIKLENAGYYCVNN